MYQIVTKIRGSSNAPLSTYCATVSGAGHGASLKCFSEILAKRESECDASSYVLRSRKWA